MMAAKMPEVTADTTFFIFITITAFLKIVEVLPHLEYNAHWAKKKARKDGLCLYEVVRKSLLVLHRNL